MQFSSMKKQHEKKITSKLPSQINPPNPIHEDPDNTLLKAELHKVETKVAIQIALHPKEIAARNLKAYTFEACTLSCIIHVYHYL